MDKPKPKLRDKTEIAESNFGISVKEGIAMVQNKADIPAIDSETLIKTGAILYKGLGIREFPDDTLSEYIGKLNKLLSERQAILSRDHTPKELQANQEAIFELANDYTAKPDPAKLFTKTVNSEEISGILTCIMKQPNTTKKSQETHQEFPATIAETKNLKITTVWKGGALNQEGQMLYLYAKSKYKGQPRINFTLQEYMADRNLINEAEARKRINAEGIKLTEARVQIIGKGISEGHFGLFGFHYHNNKILITLTQEAIELFSASKAFEFFPKKAYTLNTQANPHSLTLVTRLSNLKALNHGKARDDKHKVKELINNTDIPTLETVKEKYQRHYKQLIIAPFERDMNACKDIYSWKYIKGNGASIKEFMAAEVKITWNEHPQDQTK